LRGGTPLGVDELVRQCHLTAAKVMILALELELTGHVHRDSSRTIFPK
jgi:predicted Rossmann fold nucleotide-binding protein DprA/Smf involved in DNA uptake